MSQSPSSTGPNQPPGQPRSALDAIDAQDTQSRPARVLVIDRTPRFVAHVEACRVEDQPAQAFSCGSIHDARACAAAGAGGRRLVHADLPDGDGIDLAHELTRHRQHLQSVVVAHAGDVREAQRAVRLGAIDYLTEPDDDVALRRAVRRGLEKGIKSRRQASRLSRLRRLCDKLDRANRDVSKQVDTLCKDLISAYQELAGQMKNVVESTEYASLVRDELDLENVIRRTLEHLVDKAGPTNCAIFLPATADEYSVGGYVNYDCDSDAGELVLSHLADALAPWVAELGKLESLDTNRALEDAFGEDADLVLDRALIAFPCLHENEPLAVVALFRDQQEPFDEAMHEVCESVGPLLGQALGRVIKIHHRALPDDLEDAPDDDGDGSDFLPF